MLFADNAMLASVFDWLAYGFLRLSWWQLALYVLFSAHLSIISESLYLHRSLTHRALTFGPVPAHFFRFWLWLSTGIKTHRWVAVHRKHHAKSDLPDDPHSPKQRGLWAVLLEGNDLFQAAGADSEILRIYGSGKPDDWLERRLYSRWPRLGIALLLTIDLLLFGMVGLAVWALKMLMILFSHSVGIGITHYWGYRNFEVRDESRNILPWGLLLGGEELHNNHHTYPTAAKLSVRPYEFDIGWCYIWLLQLLGWAQVKRLPPRWRQGEVKVEADEATLDALISNRYELIAHYARGLRATCRDEIGRLQACPVQHEQVVLLKAVRRWLVCDEERLPQHARSQLAQARVAHQGLDQMLRMREDLRQLWLSTSLSREQLTADLQVWCHQAEGSGIVELKNFSLLLRSLRS